MPDDPFYVRGLCFSCTRCSACCRVDPGYVFLSKTDAAILAGALSMEYTEFTETYCRWIDDYEGKARLSLKEKANYDCVFWKKGCTVYEARPVQCRTFPFWPDILASQETWDNAGLSCPGIGKGKRHGRAYIELRLQKQQTNPVIEKTV
ncbi:MAG: YkgJ family cysteine cluster protein [Spirochaetaceae bacterium]|jgi:Fe-S-cluster containining protein|nr:YkgJ family cysteine cluster protein [Spirochaetaceae bacterium]